MGAQAYPNPSRAGKQGLERAMRTAAKTDLTQRAIVQALRGAGIGVCLTPVGGGFPDAVLHFGGFVCLAEFKSGRGKLNEMQRKFRESFQGPLIVARTGEEAVSKFFTERACALLGSVLR